MFAKLVFIVVIAYSASSMNVPRYADLDEDDQLLLRAAYDAPSYEHQEYQEDVDLPTNKLDLLKDGMWAVKAKIKEMKVFNKALAANLLATKLQLKEFVANHLKTIKKHHHVVIEKKKPVYSYQSPPPHPPVYASYEQPHYTAPVYHYEPPHYSGPVPQYEPAQHYSSPVPQYEPAQHYSGPVPQYEPAQHYSGPVPQYEPAQHYSGPVPQYEPPHQTAHTPPNGPQYEPQYGAPQYGHDPYYGH